MLDHSIPINHQIKITIGYHLFSIITVEKKKFFKKEQYSKLVQVSGKQSGAMYQESY